ncbi:MAG TPA: helix-turn-helix domain-containing protein [Pirellulales bacterium]|nr:helix-turn-helix domain-containing protein [Pirellulales bacterium]
MKLLLPREVCEILRCSKSTLYSLLESGKLVGHRCPGWRVKEADLLAYLERTRQEPPPAEHDARRPPRVRLRHLKL